MRLHLPTNHLETLAQDEIARKVIAMAEKQELAWLTGIKSVSDTVNVKADINNGLWTITMEVDHGSVVYKNHDMAGYQITIKTLPNAKYLFDASRMSPEEIAEILAKHSNSVDIDLKDINTLKAAKESLKDDYVLKHIPLDNPTRDCAARLVIWHIRAYRKIFIDYQNKYGFLWQRTGFSNARTLAGAMREQGLI